MVAVEATGPMVTGGLYLSSVADRGIKVPFDFSFARLGSLGLP